MWQRLLARMQRLGTGMATYVGLVVYFFVSIFAVPFLLRLHHRQTRPACDPASGGGHPTCLCWPPDYRQQRLLALKHTFMRTHKVRRRERAELAALLHALHLYGEPCWWCDAAAPEPCTGNWNTTDALQQCSRCGWEIAAPYRLVEDEGDSAASS
jgi:hypothetical protein